MGLIDRLKDWLSGRSPHAPAPSCPTEADILKYKEGNLLPPARAQLERHFADCHDCRDLLLLLARFPEEEFAARPPLSSAEIQQQAARVFQHIEADERRKPIPDGRAVPAPRPGWVFRHGAQLAAAAMVICALAVGVLYFLTRGESATESARQSLATAMKGERRSATRFSGGFAYSPCVATTRGDDDSSDMNLKLALIQLEDAERDAAPVAMRQMLARAHLAFDRADHAQKAQEILESLRARGVETAEVFNDLGVAQFQLRSYDAAIASFDRALKANPGYSEALFNRALAEQSAARNVDARRDWEQFINSTSDPNWKAEAERHLAALSSYSRLF